MFGDSSEMKFETPKIPYEQQAVQYHIQQNPFPSYEEMKHRIDTFPFQKASLAMAKEFSPESHSDLEAIYRSGIDIMMTKKHGKRIMKRGTGWTVRMNYQAFKLCGPFCNPLDYVVKSAGPDMLKNIWFRKL